MLNIKSGGKIACVGAAAALLLVSAPAGDAAPLPVMPRAVVASSAAAIPSTEIRYVRPRGVGGAIAGTVLGLFGLGLGLGAAIANSHRPYYPYGYYPYGYAPTYAYGPAYAYAPAYHYAPRRGFAPLRGHAHVGHVAPHRGHR